MIYFYNPAQFMWVQTLKDLYPEIKKEWSRSPLSIRKPRTNYQESSLELKDSSWDIVPLLLRNQVQTEESKLFPLTSSLVNQVPVFENLLFSIFYPGTETVPHCGRSKDIVRVHLAIKTNDKAAVCCGGQCVSLNDGEVLIFEDGEEHYAFNKGNEERIVLIFDVLKTQIGV